MKTTTKTQLNYPDGSILTFSYDPAGNRLAGPKDNLTYTYNQANQLTQSLRAEGEAASYQYDKNGNLTKKTETDDDADGQTYTYTYDYENRLIKVVKQEEDETITVTFKYDPFGRRVSKSVSHLSLRGEAEAITDEDDNDDGDEDDKVTPRTTYYVYDNEDIILEYLTKTEDNETKEEITRYIHGPGIDEPISIEKNNKLYYYHYDGLGSAIALTNQNQKTVESYTYDSFGNLKRQGNKAKNRFTYTGREYDKETGLYYYRNRYYDPKIGRFITQDPLGMIGGPNLYAYVKNNPLNWVDPFGLYEVGVGGIGNAIVEKIISEKIKKYAPEIPASARSESARTIRKEMTADEYIQLKNEQMLDTEKLKIIKNIIKRAKERPENKELKEKLKPYIDIILREEDISGKRPKK